jgi:hypothetical protein
LVLVGVAEVVHLIALQGQDMVVAVVWALVADEVDQQDQFPNQVLEAVVVQPAY